MLGGRILNNIRSRNIGIGGPKVDYYPTPDIPRATSTDNRHPILSFHRSADGPDTVESSLYIDLVELVEFGERRFGGLEWLSYTELYGVSSSVKLAFDKGQSAVPRAENRSRPGWASRTPALFTA